MPSKTIAYTLIIVSIMLFITLSFVKVGFDNQAILLCEATRSNPDMKMEDCPAHTSNIPWLITISFGIGFLVLGSGLFILFPPKTKKEKINIDPSKLDSEEKQIYEILKSNGSVYQSDLIKETGLSKVKISRVLDKLESKGIVDRKRRGMTNIVVLK